MSEWSAWIETALKVSGGLVVLAPEGAAEETLSQSYSCVECGTSLTEITPRLFSFNSPYGACPTCSGLGTLMGVETYQSVPRQMPIGRRTYADRVMAIGDAAGLVKPTTGGGIYYSIVSAQLAADVLDDALHAGQLGAKALSAYEVSWRKRLMPEFRPQLALRMLAQRLSDREVDDLFELVRTDGIMPIVRKTARFNRHRDLIAALFRHQPARRILFRRFVT